MYLVTSVYVHFGVVCSSKHDLNSQKKSDLHFDILIVSKLAEFILIWTYLVEVHNVSTYTSIYTHAIVEPKDDIEPISF